MFQTVHPAILDEAAFRYLIPLDEPQFDNLNGHENPAQPVGPRPRADLVENIAPWGETVVQPPNAARAGDHLFWHPPRLYRIVLGLRHDDDREDGLPLERLSS